MATLPAALAGQESGAGAGPVAVPSADDGGVFFVALQYKGSSYEVPVQAEDTLASIFDFAQEALDFPRENCKLIFKGKVLKPDQDETCVGDAGFQAGSKLMLVATSAHDVSFVRSSRADPLVKGFAEEARDELARKKRARAAGASAWGTKQDQQYRFRSIKAEFKYSDPPPFEAEKLLQRLATDPGIIDIMKSRRFEVGILTEMSPAEAQDRMAKRGTPNMDLLGYNQNAGEMIVLRLRTDNTKGFRPYHDLINTLIHEMTHNVWGPHDHNFWQLYGELKAQYMRFHRFWSHGGQATDSNAGGQFAGFSGDGEEEGGAPSSGFGQQLGGAGAADDDGAGGAMSPRSRAAMAAAARAAMGSGPDEPPKPNFLASNGAWIFVCPCGQVHDPAGCEVAQAAAAKQKREAAGTDDDDDDEDDDVVMAPAAPAAPVAAEAPTGGDGDIAMPDADAAPAAPIAEGASAPAALEGVAQVEEPAPAAAAEGEDSMAAPPAALGGGGDDGGGGAVSSSAPPPLEPGASVTAAGGGAGASVEAGGGRNAPGGGRGAAAAVEEGVADLDLGELEAQGLDGASLWLANFSQRLRSLRVDRGGAGAGSPAAQAAVELLLKLVRNIVSSPGEQKFRRVRADNPKVRSSLLSAGDSAEALMRMLGFEVVDDNGARVFVLKDAAFDTARLHMGKELLELELDAVSAVASAQ